MFIIDAYVQFLGVMCFLLLCGWAWRMFLRKHDPEGYRRQVARDDFVKKHGMAIGGKLLKKWLK